MEYLYLIITLVVLYLVAPYAYFFFIASQKVAALMKRGRLPTQEMIDQATTNATNQAKEKEGEGTEVKTTLTGMIWFFAAWPFYWSSLAKANDMFWTEMEKVSSPFDRY